MNQRIKSKKIKQEILYLIKQLNIDILSITLSRRENSFYFQLNENKIIIFRHPNNRSYKIIVNNIVFSKNIQYIFHTKNEILEMFVDFEVVLEKQFYLKNLDVTKKDIDQFKKDFDQFKKDFDMED